MTIQKDLFDALDAEASITATFHLTQAPVDATPPLVEIRMSDHRRTRTTGTTSPGLVTEFDIECWHTTSVLAEALADSITAFLQDYASTLNGNTKVWSTRIFNEFASSDSAGELFGSSFTVAFTHN